MNSTETFLRELLASAKSEKISISGHCQSCGDEVRLLVDQKNGKVKIDSVADDGAGLKFYPFFNKPEFLCGSCIEDGKRLGSPVECYSRVVGYLSPVNRWNKGKRAEWGERKAFEINGRKDN